MRKLAFLFAFLVMGTVAHATEVKVFEMPSSGMNQLNSYYTVDRDSGKAFVNLSVKKNIRGRGGRTQMNYYRSEFDGLRFDAATSTIVLDHEGEQIECATVSQRTVFRLDIIRETGCSLVARRTSRVEDTGYRTRKNSYYEVVLKIK